MPKYVAPSDEPLATVTFDAADLAKSSHLDDLKYEFYECFIGGGSKVKVKPGMSRTVNVRAGEPLYLRLWATTRYGYGDLWFSITPERGQDYRIVYHEQDAGKGQGVAGIRVFDSQDQPVPFVADSRTWPRCE